MLGAILSWHANEALHDTQDCEIVGIIGASCRPGSGIISLFDIAAQSDKMRHFCQAGPPCFTSILGTVQHHSTTTPKLNTLFNTLLDYGYKNTPRLTKLQISRRRAHSATVRT